MSNNTDLIPRSFDLSAVLAGRSYPEIEVHFYLDEKTALALYRAEKELTRLAQLRRIEEHDELEPKVEALRESLRSQRYTYHLRGIPNKVRQDAFKASVEKFPVEKSVFGVEEDSTERDQMYTNLIWHAMTERIVAPDGATDTKPSKESVEQFRLFAPQAAIDAIDAGISELSQGVRAGFEAAAQDTDFLSRP